MPGHAWSSVMCNSIIALYGSSVLRVVDSQPAASSPGLPAPLNCGAGGQCVRGASMQVRFWGTRGSIAAPGPATMRYGGNTSCVEVRLNDDTLIIFDAGTGLRALGQALLA